MTPFCSCSAVPLFIGFVAAGVPLGVTLSFLISAPMGNEVALVLLYGLFGWKIAAIYLATGLCVAVVAGWVIGRLGMERHVEEWVYEGRFGSGASRESLAAAAHCRVRGCRGRTITVYGPGCMVRRHTIMNPSSIPREHIPWFPTVNPTVCTGDQVCVAFCTHGVFRWDAIANRPVVEQPYQCVVGCDGCTNICTAGAISFPSIEWLGEFLETYPENGTLLSSR